MELLQHKKSFTHIKILQERAWESQESMFTY